MSLLFVINNGAITKVNTETGAQEAFAGNWNSVRHMIAMNGHLYLISGKFLSRINISNGEQYNFSGDWSGVTHMCAGTDCIYMMYNGTLNRFDPDKFEEKKVTEGTWTNVEVMTFVKTEGSTEAKSTAEVKKENTAPARVAALWGSQYFMAKVVSDYGNGTYKVIYDDGTPYDTAIDRTCPGVLAEQANAGLKVWASKSKGKQAFSAVIKSVNESTALVTWDDGHEAEIGFDQMAIRN